MASSITAELRNQYAAYRSPQATSTNEYPEKKLSEYKVSQTIICLSV
jgi:hypothetical protein